MTPEEYIRKRPSHTLSRLNKSLCSLLLIIMIIMFISYYITTLIQLELSKLTSATSKLNNENVELQNNLDKLMSYNNVEELVRRSGVLDSARHVIEMESEGKTVIFQKKRNNNIDERNYYRWSLGF